MKVLWHLEGFLGHWSFFIAGRSKLDTRFLYCMDCLEESCGMYDRSFGRNDQKSSDLFKKIKFEIRDSICNLWDRI